MPSPEIAVVIPTRARETRLAFALEALSEQTLERHRFEVVVVRDGEAPGPKAEAPAGVSIRFLGYPVSRGPAAARNLGWRLSSAPVVAFTDDDCRPSPTWLERLLAARPGSNSVLQGRTEPDPNERHLLVGLARSQTIVGPSDWYQSCNIAYPRDLLERLGGFDEVFPGPAGEDTDLGLRARAAGAGLVYADDALTWHAVLARPLPRAVREASRWDVVPVVIGRHPEQRRHIYLRYFWKRSHAVLLLAAAGGLALLRGKRFGAVAIIPYAHLWLDKDQVSAGGLIRQALHLPARALVDAAEVVATGRGAIRHRVPVI